MGYTYHHADFTIKFLDEETFKKIGNEKILITGNYLKNDAITPMYALKPLVEHNVSDSCVLVINDRYYTNARKCIGKATAAIWPWKCKEHRQVIIQLIRDLAIIDPTFRELQTPLHKIAVYHFVNLYPDETNKIISNTFFNLSETFSNIEVEE